MIGPEKTGIFKFHKGIVRANKRRVNVPFGGLSELWNPGHVIGV